MGIDFEREFTFKVDDHKLLPEYQSHHRDQDITDEPTIFEQITEMANIDEEDSDEEGNDDESVMMEEVDYDSFSDDDSEGEDGDVVGFGEDSDDEYDGFEVIGDVSDEEKEN